MEQKNTIDLSAFYRIGYGLYAITARDGDKDNALIANTVMQVTDSPLRVAVVLNKSTLTHEFIQRTGRMNVNCLKKDTPLSVFERFGYQSGRTVDKFEGTPRRRSDNGLIVLTEHSNAFFSLVCEQYIDLGTHGMFLCSVVAAEVLSSDETITYHDYQKNVKPKDKSGAKLGFVCSVCGWVYEGAILPEELICPVCGQDRDAFEPIPTRE